MTQKEFNFLTNLWISARAHVLSFRDGVQDILRRFVDWNILEVNIFDRHTLFYIDFLGVSFLPYVDAETYTAYSVIAFGYDFDDKLYIEIMGYVFAGIRHDQPFSKEPLFKFGSD